MKPCYVGARGTPVPREDAEGVSLFGWAQLAVWNGIRLSERLILIPNGSYLGGTPARRAFQMTRLKRQGFQVGASDYFLAIATGKHHGLFLELKRARGGRTSQEQSAFGARMLLAGYYFQVAAGADAARAIIETYLGSAIRIEAQYHGYHTKEF